MTTPKEPRKVSLKVFLYTLFIIVVVFGIFILVQNFLFHRSLREAQLERAQDLALALVVSERDAILDQRYQDINRDFTEIVGQPGITYLMVMDRNRRAVAHTNQKYRGQRLNDSMAAKAAESEASHLVQKQSGTSTYDVSVPVMSATHRIATVRVGINLQQDDKN